MDIHGERDSPNEGPLVVSHGWVIAFYNGTKIVCGAGAPQGKGSLLRAEGYGMLASSNSIHD